MLLLLHGVQYLPQRNFFLPRQYGVHLLPHRADQRLWCLWVLCHNVSLRAVPVWLLLLLLLRRDLFWVGVVLLQLLPRWAVELQRQLLLQQLRGWDVL